MDIRKRFDEAAGKLCEKLLPVKHEYYLGQGNEVALCTLSSMDLLEQIGGSDLMDKIAIAGRLLSENKGIDAIIKFVLEHPDLKRIIICGREVKGHMAGQALISLAQYGMDQDGKIIGAIGPYPIIKSQAGKVDSFRHQVKIIDMIGTTDIERLVA